MQWHTKIHSASYQQRLERAHLRLTAAMDELERVMGELREADESDEYRESAAEIRAQR